MKERTIIIGDIHGTLIEFQELLAKLSFDKEKDRVILVGDLIDRGDFSVETVRFARENNFECVRGNHEAKFIKWFNSKDSKVNVYDGKKYYHNFSDADINYIFNMPFYIELDDVIIVHAGLKPGVSLANQKKDDLMYLRYTDEDRKFISLKTINKLGKEKTGAIFWTEFGPFGKSVVYGHQVWDEPRIDEFTDGTKCYGIDTGCCFGGKLTALIWETKEFVQVPAKRVYYESAFNIE